MSAKPDAFGQSHRLTPVDRLGVWLSARRLRQSARGFAGKSIAGIGCGLDGLFVRPLFGEVKSAVVSDVAISDDLKAHDRVRAPEGFVPAVLAQADDRSIDLVMCVSALWNLEEQRPQVLLPQNDLWSLFVRAGCRSKNIECFLHKRGLNTFVICRVD